MPREKKKSQHLIRTPLNSWQLIVVASVGMAFCLLGIFFWQKFTTHTLKKIYPPEYVKTEVHTIPQDVKKTLKPTTAEATFRVPILMYHYVENVKNKKDTIRQLLDIVPSVFIQQIQTLKSAGYTFLTASDLAKVLDGKETLPTHPILLTFDDGHRDFYTDAFPILKKYHVKATSYVIAGFLGGSDFMTAKQVQEVAKSGLIEVGAHTVDHLSLGGKPLAQVQFEVQQSKAMLEQLIHQPVISFAYPYGSFDNQAIDVTRKAGFTTAVSTVPGIDVNEQNRYFLYRLRPGDRTGQILLDWLSQNIFTPYPVAD